MPRYVPCLKLKAGEIKALQEIGQVDGLRPMLEIPPIDWDFENEAPKRELREHLDRVVDQLAEAWPDRERPVFVDALRHLEDDAQLPDGTHPLAFVLEATSEALAMVPVVRLKAPQAARDVARAAQHGVCIRAGLAEIEGEDLAALLDQALAGLRLGPDQVDLVVDAGFVDERATVTLLGGLPMFFGALPRLREWRSLTFLSAAFPEDLRSVQDGLGRLPRRDWRLWRALRRAPRVPDFGDCGISHPDPLDADPRTLRSKAAIRYTLADCWLIHRGEVLAGRGQGGYGQFRGLAQRLIDSGEFWGEAFSAGDRYIAQCARGEVGTGSLTTWRTVGTTHHITTVLEQLAGL